MSGEYFKLSPQEQQLAIQAFDDRYRSGLHDQLRREGILDQALEMAMTTPLSLAQAGERIRATKALAERVGMIVATEPDDGSQFKTYAKAPPLPPVALHLLPKVYVAKVRDEFNEALHRLRVMEAKREWGDIVIDEAPPVPPKVRESARQARKRRKRENRESMRKAREGFILDDHLDYRVPYLVRRVTGEQR